MFGWVPLILGNFYISTSETSGGFKIFYSNNVWSVFLQKQLCLYSARLALDFNHYNHENCHLHTTASYGFWS